MGCGASSKKQSAAGQADDENSTGIVAGARDAALDVVGAVAGTVGGTAAMVGHSVATAALTVADCATLGMVDSIGDARDEQYEEMIDARDDTAAAFKAHTNTGFYRGDAPCDMSDWMSKIPDETKITAMWLPGTHDTMADNGGDIAECQSWNLKQQLQSGLRVFDIRAKHDCDNLPCFHGIIDLHHSFSGVVADLEEFLKEHPKEAVFVRMKRNGECGEHACQFHDQTVKSFTNPDIWDLRVHNWGALSLYRGKVTFIAFGSQMLLYKQPLDVQDDYKISDEDKKFEAIMQQSNKERIPDVLYISFCSAVGLEGWTCFKSPSIVAYNVNKMVLDANDKLSPGFYLFDFPGKELVNALIARNQPTPAS